MPRMHRSLPPWAVAASCAALVAACGTPKPSARAPAAAAVGAPSPAAAPRPEVLVARARALRADGDRAGAQARLEAALQLAPASDDVRLELADLLVADARDLERAAALLAGLSAPGGARAAVVSARLAELKGDDAVAAEAYERALDAGEDADLRFRRALALERLGRVDEATLDLERVRAERPDDPLARARLAERYEVAGRLVEAEAELIWLAEAQPERAAGWRRLARFYERTGRKAEARVALARAKESAPRGTRALRPLLPSKR